ncbi:DUF4411 family protein [Leuconostoc mesenteroides]|uniref:DUF4411 family protein n=1 Tax=Leuconostoc mesenteroides TaxID=1245 RepID=UPI002361BD9A|nr:DUF4411 family protein [Leuconostoc mesenteroides]
MSGYLIDSNILIVSSRNYRQKFFPIIWQFFKNNNQIYVLDKVYSELVCIDDDLGKWVKDNYERIKIISDSSIIEYRKVVRYLVESGKWNPAGYQQWTMNSDKADPWLIAVAMKNDLTIITDEKLKGPNGSPVDNEPKIPFVAKNFNVKTLTFWEFLEDQNFVAN